jgi:hypothetical protein
MRILIERLDRKNYPTPNCLLGDSSLIPIPFYLVDQAEGFTDERRIELGHLAELRDRERFGRCSIKASRPSPVTGSNRTPCN